jgi:fructose-specific phosphotransferase system IIA component
MLLTEILQPACIKVPLDAKDKESAITQLLDLLNESGLLQDRDGALEAVMNREKTRSTGIGSGLAIPHGKCKAVKELVMTIGIVPDGIDFQSVDSKPVKIIILLVSPIDQTGPHIQALASISRLMLDETFKSKLEQASSTDEVYDLIHTKETQ